ncbi:MAG: hypothetical protein ITG02_05475 [Patulibacter sp.]|nr:hypothetical protein [Patulibacter sp.]
MYLLGGGVMIAAAVAGLLPLARVPLAAAAVLLVCAAACGRDDGPWGAGVLLLAVGAGAWGAEWSALPDTVSGSHGALAGLALGVLVVVALDARGVAVGVVASATAAVATVAVVALRGQVPALERPLTWGVMLLLVGSVNMLLWARDREVALTGPRG